MTTLSRTLRTASVGDGNHEISVIATDAAQQTTTSLVRRLRVDRTAPAARIARRARRSVRVTVSDGLKAETSGVAQVAIAWGDGRRGNGRSATHRYRRAGRYAVRVTTRDKAGNRRTVVKKVVVR